MKWLGKRLLKGLVIAAPLVLTAWLFYAIGLKLEGFGGNLLRQVLPNGVYVPGLGLLVTLGVIAGLGLLANLYLVRLLLGIGDRVMSRIPLVKTVLQGLKDLAGLFTGSQTKELDRVVMVTFNGAHLMGFVTRDPADLPGVPMVEDDPLVAVYFPMSYQIGGYTAYIARSRLVPVDMPLEKAMRTVLTGGVTHEPPSDEV